MSGLKEQEIGKCIASSNATKIKTGRTYTKLALHILLKDFSILWSENECEGISRKPVQSD